MADESTTIQHLRENIKKELRELYTDREIDPITDILLQKRLGLQKHAVGLQRDQVLSPADRQWFDKALGSLKNGLPVQYVTGQAHFFGLLLDVSPDVLIPRPETEELVQWILDDLTHPDPVILDIGTGSGCIALALKKEVPESQVTGMDADGSALVVASKNAAKLLLDLQFYLHDVLTEEPPEGLARPDIIVSNPPYIPACEKHSLPALVRDHEPSVALFVPDEDPLIFYSSIARFARDQLNHGGHVYLEIHEKRGGQVCELLKAEGFAHVELRKDINGKDRMIKAMLP
jgi:release factor glutamine methyltransferase